MKNALLTWHLTPTSEASDLWVLSTYRNEVWARAYDGLEARRLTAQRFRVRADNSDGQSTEKSPWYVRELTRCEVHSDARFDSIEIAQVVYPTPRFLVAGARSDEALAEISGASSNRKSASRDVVALDIREAIVALLLARNIDTSGRWLDVYPTEGGGDTGAYVIVPARRLRKLIAAELSLLLGRELNDQQTSWTVNREEIEVLARLSGPRPAPPKVA
jgi:hypothetical protein